MPTSAKSLRLITVNKNAVRAKRIISQLIASMRESYNIEHVCNCPIIEEVPVAISDSMPDMLFCASTWTPTESTRIVKLAKETLPSIKTYVVPRGLVDREGEQAMVDHLVAVLEEVLGTS